MLRKKAIAAVAVFAFIVFSPLPLWAVVISADDTVFGVGALTRDTGQNLDFLDLIFSLNFTFNEVSGEFGALDDFAGFRYATEAEVISLINNFGFLPGALAGSDVAGNTGADQLSGLVTLLGETSPDFMFRNTVGLTSTAIPFNDVRIVQITDRKAQTGDDFVISTSSFDSDLSNVEVGSYLVKSSPVIPEPSTLVLFALGFCGILGLSYRQRKKAT